MADCQQVRLLAKTNRGDRLDFCLQFQPDDRASLRIWRNRVGNRTFWRNMVDVVEDYRNQTRRLLNRAGLTDENRELLAQAEHVEVSCEFSDDLLWQFPWEFVLVHAFSSREAAAVPLITRHTVRKAKTAVSIPPKPRMLLLDATPNVNMRKAERLGLQQQLETALGHHQDNPQCQLVEPPTQKMLATHLQASWDILHLRGMDVTRAAARGWVNQPSSPNRQGLWMPLKGVLDSKQLAEFLDDRHIHLLTCDLAYSATTFIPTLTQQQSVAALLGFFDTIDEVVSASFFQAFYAHLEQDNLLAAFRTAFHHIRNRQESLIGIGIVLCTTFSLLDKPDQAARQEKTKAAPTKPSAGDGIKPKQPAPDRIAPASPTAGQPSRTRRKGRLSGKRLGYKQSQDQDNLHHNFINQIKAPFDDSADHAISVDQDTHAGTGDGYAARFEFNITPLTELNYSLLHNSRQIFTNFDIIPLADQGNHHLRVTVALETGGSRPLSFQRLWDLDGPVDLSADIHLPLFSRDLQSLRESVKTSLQVSVASTDGKRVYYDQTHKVELLPINAWKDTPADRKWLVSFVTPGDEIIPKLLSEAQCYLNVLNDMASSGFDGYQRIDMAVHLDRCAVDHQVQALWWTLIQERRLAYINPPTNFGQTVQRLRLPADVIDQGRGTCLDLTLLLCALLEFIDIYPVIFLLKGHAFPGYWRSDKYAKNFWATFEKERPDRERGVASNGHDYYDPDLNQVLNAMSDGQLIPIESVLLAERCGFWQAVEEGIKNLTHGGEYEAMLDVRKYREAMDIQPLPIKRGDL